ncbi:MAG: hypothetical protein P1U89_08250 [Verrucomicrobiales bacterium]|nr:hypothetical protein [Verrucomicrobiales bacterium]
MKSRFSSYCFLAAAAVLTLSPVVSGVDNPDFYRDVYPFLKSNCISCHNKTTTKAGLNMETPALMIEGGDSGPSIVPGNSTESLIVEASAHSIDMEMPPKNNKTDAKDLTKAEIAILKKWIDQGAKASVQQKRQVVWKSLAPGVHPIYTVTMTEDGRFAACGRSNQIFIYDIATRQFVGQVVDKKEKSGAHKALVNALSFSPDGNLLASGGFREVKIWEKAEPPAKNNIEKLNVGIPQPDVANLTISPDAEKLAVLTRAGKLIVSQRSDSRAISGELYPVQSPTVQGTVPPIVTAYTWSADSQSVLTIEGDKTLRIWPITETGAPREIAIEEGPTTIHLATGPGKLVATAGKDSKVRIRDLSQNGKLIREIPRAGVTGLAISPDEKSIATSGADGAVRVWDIASGKQTIELWGSLSANQEIEELEWKLSRERLEQSFQKSGITKITAQDKALDVLLQKAKDAIVAMNKALPVKEKAIKPVEEARIAAQKAVDDARTALEAAPDDAKLEKALITAKDKLITAQTNESSALAAFKAVQSNISDAEEQVKRITQTTTENAEKVEEANRITTESKARHAEAIKALAVARKAIKSPTARPVGVTFSNHGNRIASVLDDGTINVWAIASGKPIEEVKGNATAIYAIMSRSDGTFLSCGADGTTVSTSPTVAWKLKTTLGGDSDPTLFADRVNAVTFSPDGKILATGGGEPSRAGDIDLFEVETGKSIASWKDRHDDSVVSLDFSPDGKLLASGSADKVARVFDVTTAEPTHLFEGHTHHVLGVSFRVDGRVLATAGADGTVNAWDMILGEKKKKIVGWNKEVTSLQFIGATNQIVTSAGDNLIRIVTDDGGQIRSISKLPDFMQSAASTPDGTTIVGGGEDSYLRIWNGTNGKELAAFGSSDH